MQSTKTLFRILTGRPIAFGNFMALKPAAVRRLVAMQELSTHVAATVLASKLRIGASRADRGTRYAGKSKMRFVTLVLHGFKGLMIFAEDVLLRVGVTCGAIAAASVLGALTAVFLKTIGFATPGWFSLALGILMLTFIQTSALALITLMLTGMVRGHAFAQLPRYDTFVQRVITRP
jgi:polyisoprenyl-phosphate glycosyltransferase